MAAPTNTKLQIHPSRAVPVASTGPPPPLPSGGGGGSAAAAPAPAAPQTSKPAVQPNLKAGKLLPSVTVLMPGAGSQILQKVSAAEDAIRRDPYDVDAWLVLWNVASGNTLSLSISRVIYEQFLLLFPTASRYWKQYIEEEMNANNYDRVERLFIRCLVKCLDLDLWKTYIRYIKLVKRNADDESRALEEMYEFVLRHMGTDLGAADVWLEYVNFLKTAPSRNQYEEGQKTGKIRKAYQRSLVLPIVNVELLWRDYDQFEHKLNKALAKGLLGEYITRFTLAKATCRERKRRSNGILFSMLARPARDGVHTQQRDYQQVILWRRFIRYERSNPQNLEAAPLRQRVIFAYKQALLTVRHYPEIWYEYALYMGETGTPEESVAVFREALKAIPYNLLMAFMYADWEEERKNFKNARAVYESLIPELAGGRGVDDAKEEPTPKVKPEAAAAATTITVKKEAGAAAAAPTTAKKDEFAAAPTSTGAGTGAGDSVMTDIAPIPSEIGVVTADGETWILPQPIPLRSPTTLPAADPLVYIQFMRFLRRTEGMVPARKLFILARKSKAVTYHSYVAAALMEYENNNQSKTASKIFTLGMADYQTVPAYACQYLDFLAATNDHNNMRVIFERVLNLIPAKDCPEIWARYVDFERNCGDLASLVKLETRKAAAFGRVSAPKTSDYLERYRFLDRYPVSNAYRETIKRSMAQFRDVKDSKSEFSDALLLGGSDASGAGIGFDAQAVAQFKARFSRPVTSGMIEFAVGEKEPSRGESDRDRERERMAKMYEKFVPDSVRTLQKHAMLPSLHSYRGAYINIDMLMDMIARIDDSKLVAELNASAPPPMQINGDEAAADGASSDTKMTAAGDAPSGIAVRSAEDAGDAVSVVAPLSIAGFAIPLPGATRPPPSAAAAAPPADADGANKRKLDETSVTAMDVSAANGSDSAAGGDEPATKKMKPEPASD